MGVLGFLSSPTRKFHLISCFISLPLNQWNFPSLSFSHTEVAGFEGGNAEATNSGCSGLMAMTEHILRAPAPHQNPRHLILQGPPLQCPRRLGGCRQRQSTREPRQPGLHGAWYSLYPLLYIPFLKRSPSIKSSSFPLVWAGWLVRPHPQVHMLTS